MARAKARRARRPKASERSAASEAVGEARQRRVEEAAAMSQRLRVLMALWMAFSVQALASAGQLCRTWRDKATGTAGKLAAASGHKKMLFRLSIIVLLVTLAMVNVCVFKTCWAARRIWEDSTAQEIERLQQAASELRAQLDCYQTPDWALQRFGATIDTRRTSPIYELRSWFSRHCFWCSVNPPDTILQPGVLPWRMLAHGRTAGPGGHQAACQNPALLCHSGAHHPGDDSERHSQQCPQGCRCLCKSPLSASAWDLAVGQCRRRDLLAFGHPQSSVSRCVLSTAVPRGDVS
eukprot:XP_024999349.1 uncharacterized protein LOC107057474 isoform X2 [Gallus gallus]